MATTAALMSMTAHKAPRSMARAKSRALAAPHNSKSAAFQPISSNPKSSTANSTQHIATNGGSAAARQRRTASTSAFCDSSVLIGGLLLAKRLCRVEARGAAGRNGGGHQAGGDDDEQTRGVGDGIEDMHNRANGSRGGR